MKLKIGCKLDYYTTQNIPLVLLIRPRSGEKQSIIYEEFKFEPHVPMIQYTDVYGNYCQRLLSPKGDFSITSRSIVETEEFSEVNYNASFTLIQNLPEDTLIYLLPSRYCESDKMNAQTLQIIKGLSTGFQMVEAIRQWVNSNIVYEYNRSNTSTSALDTLEIKHGVCRDLSHLAIAMCRSINIPTRFVVGYLYRLYPMDLHAWFEAFIDGKWYTFDATQKITTGGRVVLAYGRDAADVATATYFGAMQLKNMMVYVEKSDEFPDL
jgi:transglutaminase-like putative cysteine protease